MNLLKVVSAALLSFAVSDALAPQVGAHNTAKYTGIPFVVAGSCPQYDSSVSSKFVTVNKQLQLQSLIDDAGNAGFEIYASSPSSGTLPTTAGTIPEGILTFNIAGLPSTGFVYYFVQYSDGSKLPVTNILPVNGVVTVPANNATNIPGSSVIAVQVYFYTAISSGTFATVTATNFRYNNSVLNLDTTITDQSATGTTVPPSNFCNITNQ